MIQIIKRSQKKEKTEKMRTGSEEKQNKHCDLYLKSNQLLTV